MKRFNETYRNRQFITRNEWADTYKAIHADTEEDVILKVLIKQSNDENYINNLLEEVEKIKKLKKENLINVNNMFQYNAFGKIYPYIEGEYFKGVSLSEEISKVKFNKEEVVKIILEMAKSMREFHKENIVFNNLNLDNIYINNKNIVKLDTLIYLENKKLTVEINKDDEDVTNEESIEETFNPAKDIYDLGVVLYSLLSGQLRFEKEKLKKYIDDKKLLCMIEKATNDKLENKYLTMGRFIADLKSYILSGELSSDEEYVEEEIIVKPKRKKGKVSKTLGICATLAIVIGGSIYGYDLVQKNNIPKDNKTEIVNEKTNQEKDKVEKEESKEEVVKEEVVKEENKITTTSNNTNNNPSSGSSTTNNSTTNNVNTPSVDTSIPNNNQNSGNVNTIPNEENNSGAVEETPQVPANPIPDNSVESSGGSEVITPEVPQVQVEGE